MLDYALLDALGAVVRLGSFDRAARELNVTPSAVSQRVKLLEERVGSVLVKRGQPCIATPPGALLCRHIERVQRLETELGGQMPTLPGMLAGKWPTFRMAVNDDSVGTWFIDAISGFCAEREMLLDLVIEDQEYTAQQLRDGSVQGAVTTQAEPVQGCRSTKLGRMRYLPVCSPAYFDRHFSAGVTRDALRHAPRVDFSHALRKSVKIFCSTSTFRYDDRPASAGGQRRCPQHEAVDSRLTAVPSLPTGSPRASPSA